jgi:hypothetical protein
MWTGFFWLGIEILWRTMMSTWAPGRFLRRILHRGITYWGVRTALPTAFQSCLVIVLVDILCHRWCSAGYLAVMSSGLEPCEQTLTDESVFLHPRIRPCHVTPWLLNQSHSAACFVTSDNWLRGRKPLLRSW